MANPTLVGNVTPWAGFTLATIAERLLAAFGLTEDATTLRTIASADESATARTFLRRSVGMLNGRFPSIWSLRETTGTWTSGDHSISLPTQARSVAYVLWDGVPLDPMTRDDELRVANQNTSSGSHSVIKTGTGVRLYRTTGYVTGTNVLVLRLYETPTEAKTYAIGFNTLAPAMTTEGDAIPYSAQFAEWILAKAKELWASELNDTATKQNALLDLKRIEDDLIPDAEAMIEVPHRLKWRFPNPAGMFQRRSIQR